MRSARGIQLLEMVVAVGLSGVFVVLLSGMLAQTLSLSTASQNQILAGAIADGLVERLQSGAWNYAASQTVPDFPLDVQTQSFGTFNLGDRWLQGTGNQFAGTVTVTLRAGSADPTIYDVRVEYPSNGGTKALLRTATYWPNGATF